MGVAEFALVISGVALTVSIGNLIWSIWSKFIQPKPRIKLAFNVMLISDTSGGVLAKSAIQISATNFGPNDVVITGVSGLSKRFKNSRFDKTHFIIFATSSWPYEGSITLQDHGSLPKRITVGDRADWYLPLENRYFSENDMTHFGLNDSFGRTHWAKRKHVNSVRQSVIEHLAEKSANEGSSE